MPYRLTKIYTRKGDSGFTQFGNKKISKDDLLIEAIGMLDELNAHIGFVNALPINDEKIPAVLSQIQQDLFHLGGELHSGHRVITAEKITWLEQMLDDYNATLPPLAEFLLPGGNTRSAAMHIARTVCRRTERCLVGLHRQMALKNPELLRYLNRLSDLLFVLARVLARETGEREILWQHEKTME